MLTTSVVKSWRYVVSCLLFLLFCHISMIFLGKIKKQLHIDMNLSYTN